MVFDSEKKLKVKRATVVFDPSIKEFSVILGERFLFSTDTRKFEWDRNPYDAPEGVPFFRNDN
ncbi:hypothetical protein SAMN04487894_107173 [Niabella drilacis]|uniref:Uncharacterized protein n=1 Tax=Niabella drilacis (strain DSM 25811 / CCM 8410 / CCUG 62505 / LMG 26954 / E90) TaxID=1285928 RepID=A0A1G6TCR8_NIADE|nr:hypothetical protein SAMN04487894_107173 [Niabella drilacis]